MQMSDSFSDARPVAAARTGARGAEAIARDGPAPRPKPPPIVVGRVEGVTMFAKNTPLICIKQLP
ncbi:hypothetical protein, partial [Burkholderia sp. BCC1974]|uniref:hypothetical protein n=1 Tax=Burkholderia sp. BCC1974 TaxID=2817439 RepID=UPI002ABE8784